MISELFEAIERGATVVTAEHRLARSLRREYALAKQRAGAKSWTEPYVLPWFGWLERCWREVLYSTGDPLPAALNAFQEEMLWEAAVASSPTSEDLLQLGATARAARRSWATVHAWRLPLAGQWWEHNQDATEFLAWSREFRNRCSESRRLDPAVLADSLRSRIAGPREIWFTGFDELTLQQREIADSLDSVLVEPNRQSTNTAALHEYSSAEDELQAAAEWARSIVLTRPLASVGIVLPDLGDVRRAASRIFRQALGGAVHISYGEPLTESPAIHAALQLLDLARSTVPMATMSAILLSPFVAGWDGERGARARFDAWLRSQGRLEWSWRAVHRQDRCPNGFGTAVGEWELIADSAPSRQRPSAWSRTLSRLLHCFGWTAGTALLQRAWERVLSALASLDSVLEDIPATKALTLLRRAASRAQVEEENTGEPVQVLSLDESGGLEFDHLWIGGMDDVSWPRPSSPDPFIPVSLQRERNLPHSSPARELEWARSVTERLLAAAPEVVASFAVGTGDRRLAPSPLVANLRRDSRPRAVPVVAPAPLESVEEAHAPPVDMGVWQTGGTRTLQLQASCPFRAFAEIRLAARPLEEPELGLDPREKGKVMHAAMEIVWRDLECSNKLRAMNAEVLAQLVSRAVQQALRHIRGFVGTPFEERLRALESRRLTRLIAEWLAMEKSRVGDFAVAEMETAREVEIGGLRLRTRIDRADRVVGGLVLIDYKSGEPSVKSWDGDRPAEPQVPLYAVTQSAQVAGVAFAQVRTGGIQFKGYTTREGLLPKAKVKDVAEFAEMQQGWLLALTNLATAFREGRADVSPKSPAECGYCHLHSLCRIAEHEPSEGDA